jgi:DNA repair protein SbcC/Rad50
VRPIRLRARNLRTFPDLDITFEQGLTGILGELRDAPEGADSNGAGKSTLLEAIDIALFGRRSLAGYLTRGGDVDELMVELEFEHAAETYRVRRTYSARGRGKTSVDLDVWKGSPLHTGDDTGPSWEPLTRASTRETDDAVCELLGLSRDTFRDSAYLRQGDGGYADPDRDPRQRKQLLVEAVLGRDPVWPKLQELAKARRKQAETQLERNRGEAETLAELAGRATAAEYEATQAEEQVVTASDAVSGAERRQVDIATRYQAAREQAAARQALEAELREAEQTLATLEERAAAAAIAEWDFTVARDELESLATPDQLAEREAELDRIEAARVDYRDRQNALAEAQRERDRADQLRAEAVGIAAQLRERARLLYAQAAAKREDAAATCQTCGQPVADEAKDRAIGELETLAEECDQKAVENDEAAERQAALVREGDALLAAAAADPVEPPDDAACDAAKAAVRSARDAGAQRARLEERIRQLQETAAGRPPPEEIGRAQGAVVAKRRLLDDLEPVDVALIESEGAAVGRFLEEARRRRDAAVAAKARCDERVAQIRAAEQKLAELTSTIEGLQEQIDRDVLLERAYGRDGIPALIIENTAIPQIEAEASRILQALGTCFQVELRTQTETKTGALRDTLEVVVIDQDGNEADYADGCSGGEQTRIGLALRIALARLLARRRGAESRLLALDEPSYLDAAGMTALLDVLRGLEHEFDVILLVSHVAELRDALDETITVIREAGRSRIDGTREPVEAVA